MNDLKKASERLARFARLKDEVEALKRREAQVQGTLDAVKARLRDEFGAKSLAAAKSLLTKLEKERDKVSKDFDVALAAFEKSLESGDA